MSIKAGTRLGRYEIQSQIGAGGMGEVYLAQDTRLDRKVAIKFLNEEFSRDADKLRRFVQEAKAASALNHPNILTVYEIGEADEKNFIATEFIEGETLREKNNSGELNLLISLDIAEQVAFALSAAHSARIAHRDLKPENIMIRHDGIVKVLDFGLAKLLEKNTKINSVAEDETRALIKTNPGMVMGTVGYMSPEQARGKDTDERTDIWSLGVVIYEMAARCLPFAGETVNDMIAAILTKEPLPLSPAIAAAPTELQRIVSKTLRKDREERYQYAKDLRIDLKDLRQELEFQSKLKRSFAPPKSSEESATLILSKDNLTEAATVAISTKDLPIEQTQSVSSVEYIVGEIRKHRAAMAGVVLIALLAVVGISFGVYKFAAKPNKQTSPLTAMKLARLTASGKVSLATISSDGRYVVHVVDDGGQQSLWMRQTATQSNVQIVAPEKVRYSGLTFSIDGNYIFYVKGEEGKIRSLYQTPALGGAVRKVLEDVDSPVTFSPDGKQFAFVEIDGVRGETSLVIANTDGSGVRTLSTHKEPEYFSTYGAAWAPDGKTIVCGIYLLAGAELIEIAVADGAEKLITSHNWGAIGQVAWLPDGSGFVMDAADQSTGYYYQMWSVARGNGEPRKITNDLSNYSGASLTADSKTLLTVQTESDSTLWVAPAGDANRARQITSGKRDGILGIAWTTDNKIVYVSRDYNISVMDADGSNQKLLTADEHNSRWVAVSPDNHYIVFESWRKGDFSDTENSRIWRMDRDGGNPKPLTKDKATNSNPQVSSDGKWVVYESNASGKTTLWKVPIDGGEAVQLINEFSLAPVISPDGKMMAYIYRHDLEPFKMAVVPFDGGQPRSEFEIPHLYSTQNTKRLRWSADGRAVLFVVNNGGVSNIWSQPIAGGQPKQITDFKSDRIFSFDWSRDGKQLVAARGTVSKDAVLISNFK